MDNNDLFIDTKLPKPLTQAELFECINKAQEGNLETRDKAIIHNIKLVLYRVNSNFKNVDYDKKDLVSIGNIGLIKAINNFDTSRQIAFTTYATRCIDNEILCFLRQLKKDQNVDSLDRVINYDKDGRELKVKDTLNDDTDLVQDYTDKNTYQIIRKIINELPMRNREIIIMYFGFDNNKRYTQKEIAKKFKIEQSVVSRLINRIIKELSYKFEEQGIIELKDILQIDNKKGPLKVKQKGEKKMSRKLQSIYK